MFLDRISPPIRHEDADELEKRNIRLQRPDHVFGLGMTKSFRRYTSERPLLRHSPLVDEGILYPFLILEAKSEKGSPGFESVECQTALTVRTCLQLQKNLEEASGVRLDPLVWFIGFQGDEWRLYAAVPEDSKTVSPTHMLIISPLLTTS